MNLPEGLKHAVTLGANEVLLEWLPSVIEDPKAVIDGNDLGSTYQAFLDESSIQETDAHRMLGELAAWDTAGPGATVYAQLDATLLRAALEFARGLISLATGVGSVPAAVRPYEAELAPLVATVKQAIADGAYDDEDVQSLVW